MNPAPTFSVIINCLNAEKYLREAIDSVYAQTFSDWEIILWDNCSTDRTAQIAKGYDQRLKYFKGEKTIPLGAARNRALEKSAGRFVAFLDSDDWWFETKLEQCLQAFSDKKIGLVYGNCSIFYSNGKRKALYPDSWEPPKGKIFASLLEHPFINFQTVVVRKNLLQQMNHWFDESFEVAEDLDFLLRFSLLADAWGLPEKLSAYRIHSNSFTWKKSSCFINEKIRILDKLEESSALSIDQRKEIEKRFLSSSFKVHGIASAYHGNRSQALTNLLAVDRKDFKVFCLIAMVLLMPYNLLRLVIEKRFFS